MVGPKKKNPGGTSGIRLSTVEGGRAMAFSEDPGFARGPYLVGGVKRGEEKSLLERREGIPSKDPLREEK